MFFFGLLVFLFGALGLVATLGMNLAPSDAATVNLGLMATRGMFVTATSAFCVAGAVFMGCGAIRNELRRGKASGGQASGGKSGGAKAKKGEKREPNLDSLQWPAEVPLNPERRERAAAGK